MKIKYIGYIILSLIILYLSWNLFNKLNEIKNYNDHLCILNEKEGKLFYMAFAHSSTHNNTKFVKCTYFKRVDNISYEIIERLHINI